jgi:hypothetical protein
VNLTARVRALQVTPRALDRFKQGERVTNLWWNGIVTADFESLVRAIPAEVLASPRRSVVPLVDFFRRPEWALAVVGRRAGLDLAGAAELAFEHAVSTPKGRGKASFTDLLVRCPESSVAIEAKYTEPRYESVRSWLASPPKPNRIEVFAGWLSLINPVAATPLEMESVLDLPYKLVHRTASACSTAAGHRALVYLIFGDDPGRYYAEDVAALDRALGEPTGLAIHVLSVPLASEPAFAALTDRWDAGERKLAADVREALLAGPLFRFDTIRALYDRPGPRSEV